MELVYINKLEKYIKEELTDAALYKAMAESAPTPEDAELLNEFARDEEAHAQSFASVYRRVAGKNFTPSPFPESYALSYRDALRDRVLDESAAFGNYRDDWLSAPEIPEFKKALFRAGTDEAVHAMRLLYLLSGNE